MTRKDYELMADIIRRQLNKGPLTGDRMATIQDIALEMSYVFGGNNERFNFERFYVACGLNFNGTLKELVF